MSNFKNELREYFWPRVDNANAAKRVARSGAGAALFEGGFEALLTTLSLARANGVMRLGATTYLDASVFLILGVFIYRGPSRGASLLALCCFAVEIIWRIEHHLPENDPVFVLIFAWFYILGVRGTFAWYSHLQAASRANESSPQGATP
jgi:hypothetical protein